MSSRSVSPTPSPVPSPSPSSYSSRSSRSRSSDPSLSSPPPSLFGWPGIFGSVIFFGLGLAAWRYVRSGRSAVHSAYENAERARQSYQQRAEQASQRRWNEVHEAYQQMERQRAAEAAAWQHKAQARATKTQDDYQTRRSKRKGRYTAWGEADPIEEDEFHQSGQGTGASIWHLEANIFRIQQAKEELGLTSHSTSSSSSTFSSFSSPLSDLTLEQVKLAFKTKALETHPDREGGNAEAFQRVNMAYETLLEAMEKKNKPPAAQNNT